MEEHPDEVRNYQKDYPAEQKSADSKKTDIEKNKV